MQILRKWVIFWVFAACFLTAGWAQQWEYRASMPTARKGMAVAVLDGKIWVIGGRKMGHHFCDEVEVYDPALDSWSTQYDHIHYEREYATAQVWNGKIYLFGGKKQSTLISAVEMYDPADGHWQTVAQMPVPRFGMTSVVKDSLIWLIGGSSMGNASSNQVVVFNPQDNSWSTLPASLNFPRSSAMAGTPSGQVVVAGGIYYGPMSSVERYDAATASWVSVANLPFPCGGAGAATDGNRLWIVGGFGQMGTTDKVLVGVLQGTELQWQEAPSLNTARRDLVAAVVNHTLYAIGGVGSYQGMVYNTVEALNLLVGIDDPDDSPSPAQTLHLSAFPNPFRTSTRVQVEQPASGTVNLSLYDVLGRRITTLFQGHLSGGIHQFLLNPGSGMPSSLANGTYFLRVENGQQITTVKIHYLGNL